MPRSFTPSVLTLVLLLVATACSGDAGDSSTTAPPTPTSLAAVTTTEASPTTADTTTTAAPTTTTTTTSTTTTTTSATTTAAPTTTAAGSPFVYAGFPEVFGGPLDAHGSGCAPGPGALPDGIWFVFAKGWTSSSVEFDLACFYSGDAATAEAAARGEESPPPNDYIITNDSPTLRTMPVAAGAIGHKLDNNVELEAVPFADFIADPGDFQACFQFCLMWLYVNNGEVTEVVSQYVP